MRHHQQWVPKSVHAGNLQYNLSADVLLSSCIVLATALVIKTESVAAAEQARLPAVHATSVEASIILACPAKLHTAAAWSFLST